jgi:hypothetical protein
VTHSIRNASAALAKLCVQLCEALILELDVSAAGVGPMENIGFVHPQHKNGAALACLDKWRVVP